MACTWGCNELPLQCPVKLVIAEFHIRSIQIGIMWFVLRKLPPILVRTGVISQNRITEEEDFSGWKAIINQTVKARHNYNNKKSWDSYSKTVVIPIFN